MTDARRDDDVVITALGVLSAIGEGCAAFERALFEGRHGIRPVTRFATEGYPAHLAGTLEHPRWDALFRACALGGELDPVAPAALVAAREAYENGRLDALDPTRVALVFGTTAGGLFSRALFEFTPREQTERRASMVVRGRLGRQTAYVADALGLRGPRITVSTACTSSTHALAHAMELLHAGAADAVLAGGADLLVEEMFAGFCATDSMSGSPCAPFSEPVGMNVGEGAGFFVLERARDAAARGMHARAVLLGYGFSLDAFHAISPEPNGAGVARALGAALADAGIEPARVGYVNAHGTGTEANDPAEWRAIQRVFGARAATLPVSSTKSYLGHALGAAGVLECAATLLAMEHGCVPPTLSFTRPRGVGPADPVASDRPRAHAYAIAACTNSAFGGANAAVLLARPGPRAPRATPRAAAAVVLAGLGVVAAHGARGFDAALRAGRSLATAAQGPTGFAARIAPSPALGDYVRGVDPRGIDAMGTLLSVATQLALSDAGVKLAGPARDRTGLYAITSSPSSDTTAEFWGSIRARGHTRLSASAFSRIVVNASAGAVSRALGIRGPISVIAGGAGSTLAAAALASEALGHHAAMERCAVTAGAELTDDALEQFAWKFPGEISALFFPGEAAVSVLLARAPVAPGATVGVLGWGMAAPGELGRAVREALARARIGPGAVDAVYGAQTRAFECDALGELSARGVPRCDPARAFGVTEVPDALALAAAACAVREGRAHDASERAARTVLVVSADPEAGCFALALGAWRHSDG